MPLGTYMGFGYAKALIFGEYAVLHGAPGLVAALSPRLNLTLHHLRSVHREMPSASLERFDDFTQQLQAILRQFLKVDAELSLDMHEFFDAQGQKIGIGSSAAAVVALVDAWCQSQQVPLDLDLAIQMHRALQHGMGSGVDIIASTLGGLQLVRHCPDHPEIVHVPLDHLPPTMVLASHIEAPTRHFIAACRAVEHEKAYQCAISALTEKYECLAQQILLGKKRDFLEEIDTVSALLQKLGSVIDMPILPKIYEDLRPLAQTCGVVLKTSGAGGGDIFLAMAEKRCQLETFVAQIPPSCGMTPLDVHWVGQRI